MEQLHELMNQFALLNGSRIGYGHRHPQNPNLELAQSVTTFIAKFPFLQQYDDYITFLECYAGAGIYRPTQAAPYELYLDIVGFTHVSSHMYEEMSDDGMIEDGFFTFCIGMINSTVFPSYGLRAVPDHTPGVYRSVATREGFSSVSTTYQWLCSSFSDFLAQIIAQDGVV